MAMRPDKASHAIPSLSPTQRIAWQVDGGFLCVTCWADLHGVCVDCGTLTSQGRRDSKGRMRCVDCADAVSYTHLTLPTICSV
eukprot:1906784-Prymnesium_polylepis.2